MLPAIGDFEGNLERIEQFIEMAVSEGAEVVVFPELTISGYTWDEAILKRGALFFQKSQRKSS